MSKVRLTGTTSGFTELTAPAVAGSNTITLPSGNGSANQLLKNGATAGSLEFASNVVIDSSNRLLVGTSSVRNVGGGFQTAQNSGLYIEQPAADVTPFTVVLNRNDTNGPRLFIGKTRGTTVGSVTIVNSGDELGQINFAGADGTGVIEAAQIRAHVDGTPGTNDMPGRLVFSTTADGASSPTERMRIASDGNVFFNTTSNPLLANSIGVLNIVSDGAASRDVINIKHTKNGNNSINIWQTGTTSFGALNFYKGDVQTSVGSIVVTTTATAYNTSSDYRIKENVVPLTGAIDRLNNLQVRRFNFVANPNLTVDGFIAHEAQTVVPESVTGEKDEVDENGSPIYQGIDQSKVVPLLTAALQEAIAKIEALEARITALEVN
jgi:hypothetical protein